MDTHTKRLRVAIVYENIHTSGPPDYYTFDDHMPFVMREDVYKTRWDDFDLATNARGFDLVGN